jgi:hypothetical protein
LNRIKLNNILTDDNNNDDDKEEETSVQTIQFVLSRGYQQALNLDEDAAGLVQFLWYLFFNGENHSNQLTGAFNCNHDGSWQW